MNIMEERAGEIRVVRHVARPGVDVHITGSVMEVYPVVHLSRQEARHLAALILMQAERAAEA
jgi:hypothetical protein